MLDAARDADRQRSDRPVARLHTEKAIERWQGIAELDRRCPGAGEEAAAAGDTDVAAVLPASTCRGRLLRDPRSTAFETHLREVVLPASEGEGRLGRRAVRGEDGPHRLLDRADAGSDQGARAEQEFGAVRAEMIRIAREIWPDWCGDGRAAGRRRRGRPRRPRRDRRPAPRPRRHPRLLPRGAGARSRRSAGSATSSAWPTSRSRSAGRRCSCGRSAGRCSTRRAVLDRGQKAFFSVTPIPDDWSAGAGRVLPPRGQRPDAPPPDDPRGRPGPLPPGRLREPLSVDRPSDLLERHVRRGVGRLRDPGDDGLRLRRRRSGPAPEPLEVLPPGGDQRDHRRRDPHGGHDRGARRSR